MADKMPIKLSVQHLTLALHTIFLTTVFIATATGLPGPSEDKLRVCILDGRGSFNKSHKYCPILEESSNIECVIGVDRLDCVRRIHKGSAHFGVFSAEDLIAARWAGVEVLVTNEMRFNHAPFEYEIVAVVDNEAGINTPHDLRGSKFCHPGHGLHNHWTEVLANYFESMLVARQCDEDLSLAESRIKASSKFFGPSCKAGPWVPDPIEDRTLKKRYPSLCQICGNPDHCGIGDKHWGRRGPLYCLTSGAGEVAWVRLDDVRSHFGLSGLPAETDPAGYSLLCPDGHLQPINTKYPCVWVAKPWPAVAVKREYSEKIQEVLEQLSHDDQKSWQNALLNLLETYHVDVTPMDISMPIEDYLDRAVGFQGSYSFPSCNPPRSVVYCTTSIIQHAKCSWLQEASSVYGIEPNLQCIRTEHLDRCMDDVKHRVSDVVLVSQDDRIRAQRDYSLKPILYEFSSSFAKRYAVVAVVSAKSRVKSFEQLRDKTACFPSFEGAAFLSVGETLLNKSLIQPSCNLSSAIRGFFSSQSCHSHAGSDQNCRLYHGDEGALKCLVEGHGDVAFLGIETWQNFVDGKILGNYKASHFDLLCPFGSTKKIPTCYLHWTAPGHLMIHNTTNLMRRNEIYNSLRDMDRLFGKTFSTKTQTFTLFGPFDKKNNVLFRDATDGLRGSVDILKDRAERSLETVFSQYSHAKCIASAGVSFSVSNFFLLGALLTLRLFSKFSSMAS
ncbi:transferrin [Phlebotomus argentipes]|uniref:transferrin n=1 Tax=Phlebotomus argentipes TaxID=94469 RepID=UPI0028936154|nr:transferrin [Phlebotomus argentipes]